MGCRRRLSEIPALPPASYVAVSSPGTQHPRPRMFLDCSSYIRNGLFLCPRLLGLFPSLAWCFSNYLWQRTCFVLFLISNPS